jgi:hypothetical protein
MKITKKEIYSIVVGEIHQQLKYMGYSDKGREVLRRAFDRLSLSHRLRIVDCLCYMSKLSVPYWFSPYCNKIFIFGDKPYYFYVTAKYGTWSSYGDRKFHKIKDIQDFMDNYYMESDDKCAEDVAEEYFRFAKSVGGLRYPEVPYTKIKFTRTDKSEYLKSLYEMTFGKYRGFNFEEIEGKGGLSYLEWLIKQPWAEDWLGYNVKVDLLRFLSKRRLDKESSRFVKKGAPVCFCVGFSKCEDEDCSFGDKCYKSYIKAVAPPCLGNCEPNSECCTCNVYVDCLSRTPDIDWDDIPGMRG